MKKIILLFILFATNTLHAEEHYFVESSYDSGTLQINGMQFAARSYCNGITIGDEVVFLDGNPDGTCSNATIIDLRTSTTCEVLCHAPF